MVWLLLLHKKLPPQHTGSKQHFICSQFGNKYFKKDSGRQFLLGGSHTFAFRCQLGLQSSEDPGRLVTQWLTLMAVEAVDSRESLGAVSRSTGVWALSCMVISELADFLHMMGSFGRVSIPKGPGRELMVFSVLTEEVRVQFIPTLLI